jgi:hypothetical protein
MIRQDQARIIIQTRKKTRPANVKSRSNHVCQIPPP